jgi:tripartite ATP-independent transporter DctP family solute receptor
MGGCEMGRKKRALLLVAASVFAFPLMLSVCGWGEAAAPEFVIKVSCSMNIEEAPVVAILEMKKQVEARTNGRVKIEVYPNNQLGNERDVTEGLILNTVQAANPSNAVVSGFLPEMNVFEFPFIWRDSAHMTTVVDGPIGARFAEPLRAKGLHLLGYMTTGLRHVMTTRKAGPINSINDLKGLKIRVMENQFHLGAWKVFGTNPLPMAYGELYTALQQGVIDGAEAANTNYLQKKFYEPAPNWAMVGWLRLVNPFLMSEKFWQSLPKDIQTILTEEGRKASTRERKLYDESDIKALDLLKKEDVKITTPDRGPFIEASKEFWKEWAPKVGGRAVLDEIVNAK